MSSKNNQKNEEEFEKVEEKQEQQKQQDIINHPEDDEEDDEVDEGSLRKKKQVEMFKKYLQQTGIAMAFQVIFAEILDKKIEEQKIYSYTATRLRQIGEDLEKIKMSKK